MVYEVVKNMSEVAMRTSDELMRIANKMQDEKDLTYASEALGCIGNMINQMRLDLIPTRIIRAIEKQ